MKKIQNTSFNVEAIKSMGFDEFRKTYEAILRGDIKKHFETITGEKVRKPKPKSDDA